MLRNISESWYVITNAKKHCFIHDTRSSNAINGILPSNSSTCFVTLASQHDVADWALTFHDVAWETHSQYSSTDWNVCCRIKCFCVLYGYSSWTDTKDKFDSTEGLWKGRAILKKKILFQGRVAWKQILFGQCYSISKKKNSWREREDLY